MKYLLTDVPKKILKIFGNISGKCLLTICNVKKFTKVESLLIAYRIGWQKAGKRKRQTILFDMWKITRLIQLNYVSCSRDHSFSTCAKFSQKLTI